MRRTPAPARPPPRSHFDVSDQQGHPLPPKGTENWSIKFYLHGALKRESTGTSDRTAALAFLQRRLDQAKRGTFIDVSERITFKEMQELLRKNYEFKRNRSDPGAQVKRLAESFGSMLGEEITETRISEYSRKRLETDRVEPATLRRELAILKRMLRLASPRLPRIPVIDMPRVDNARQGFFEEADLQIILPPRGSPRPKPRRVPLPHGVAIR